MSESAVLERFLKAATRAGAWDGVGLLAKGAILRFARRDPGQTFRRIDQLVALWLAAKEENDGTRGPGRPGDAGSRRRLGGDAGPPEGALHGDAERAPRAHPQPGAVTAGAGARSTAGAITAGAVTITVPGAGAE